MNLTVQSPAEIRLLIKSGELKRKPTRDCSSGFMQANLAILPKKFAKDFAQFAKRNAGPCPVLYESEVGEYSAPPLCRQSDVRCETPWYIKLTNGKVDKKEEYLIDYDWSDMVTFYIGCSFSFNQLLLDHHVVPPELLSHNTSMFVTNVECLSSGPFGGKMVVSMIPVAEENLSLAASLTNLVPTAHGAPIQFGNAGEIGIVDVLKTDFGETTEIKDGFVPVFWCCGVTVFEAIKYAKPSLAFTHVPGSMFITDVPLDKIDIEMQEPLKLCEVVKFSKEPQKFSVLSKQSAITIKGMIDKLNTDGQTICNPDVFLNIPLALSHCSRAVLEITSLSDISIGEQLSIVVCCLIGVLQSIGKEVVIVTESKITTETYDYFDKCTKKGIMGEVPTITTKYECVKHGNDTSFQFSVHIIKSSETMNLIHITEQNNFIKVDVRPEKFDFLLCALSFAMYVLRSCPVHDRYLRKGLGFQPDMQEIMGKWLLSEEKVDQLIGISSDDDTDSCKVLDLKKILTSFNI